MRKSFPSRPLNFQLNNDPASVEQLRKQLSELRADNNNLRARANTASIPQQNSNINPRQEDFYKNEIQRHKQKIAALESELSNAQTGQYEKPMPFGAQGGGNQERLRREILAHSVLLFITEISRIVKCKKSWTT